MTIGALEAGGTKMVLAAFDETGKELERMTIPTEEPAVTMPPMQQFFDRWKIDALGVGSFGPLDPNPDSPTYGYITSTPKLKWKDYPLLPELLHHGLHPGRGHLGQIHRREKANGNAQQDRPRRTVNAGEDKGQDTVGRLRRRRRPFIAEQERDQPDLPNGGNARNDQINRNQQYTGHSDQTQY